MASREQAVPIIRTKLHRPPVTRDILCREALHARLDEAGQQALILVCAPAGYGKSTVVSYWLETRGGPVAWLSLDDTDSDVRTFLGYVVAAVQSVFPEACAVTQAQLEAEALAPLPVLAGCLGNDLDDLEESLVLVLDDYHCIQEPAVHELMNHLLKHPPGPLQLVVISRRDPPLSFGALRAHNTLTEIRMQDLMFTPAETTAFLEQSIGQTVGSNTLARLQEKIEGWAAGLRLAALALRHHADADAFLRGFDGAAIAVHDYMIEEVLAQQLPAVVDCLCKSSILKRFCAPLCEVVGADPADKDADHFDGATFIRLLEDSGLFCIDLDERGEWHRYHHLFQELLQRQLKAKFTPDKIAGLHRRAASWFEDRGLLEEAIHHALQADGPAEAGRLMVRHRNDILNQEQWHRLTRWLNLLPVEVVDENPELLLLKAWQQKQEGHYAEVFKLLDRIEERIGDGPPVVSTERLRGAVDALRCVQRYLQGEGDLARQHAEQALIQLPADCLYERAYISFIKSVVLQMCGDIVGARKFIHKQLADNSVPLGIFQTRLHVALCFISWIAADLPSLRLAAKHYFELSEALGLPESLAIARYFLGIADYQENELSKAETFLIPVVAEAKAVNLEYSTESAFVLASVYQASGLAGKARETIESVCKQLRRINDIVLLQRALAYQADLALRQGRMATAVSWAQGFDPDPLAAVSRFFEPRQTLAKVLIAQGTPDSLVQAGSLLARLQAFYLQIHNTRCLIEVLTLQALLHDAQGDEPAALKVLSRAVHLAQSGGLIRLFVDLGPGVTGLLNRLDLDAEGQRYVGTILAACQSDGEAKAGTALDHPLTKRELEILTLLANELSNKQISDRLCISPSTVKRHTENIYHKLAVPDRHKAVVKATQLAIIRSN